MNSLIVIRAEANMGGGKPTIQITIHENQWFGWTDSKNKIYANLIVHDGGSKPTEKQCTDGLKALQDAWDAANGG